MLLLQYISLHNRRFKVGTHLATSCSNTLQRHVAATNRFVCAGQFLWKSLSPQHNFVTTTSRKKSNQTEFVRLVAATKLCCREKDFRKNSPVHTRRFVVATCRRNVFLQLVDGPLHMEWSVAATCCCNLSPSVYRRLWAKRGERSILHEAQNECEARNEGRRSIIKAPPLVSRVALFSHFAQNAAFVSLGSLSACYAGCSTCALLAKPGVRMARYCTSSF